MTEKEKINEMAKYICNACEMGCGFDGDCDEGSDYKTCGICQETAKKIYDEIICKNPPTDKETVPYLRRVCRIFEIALNNALGIDHNYTDAYKEAEKEYEEEEARRNADKR